MTLKNDKPSVVEFHAVPDKNLEEVIIMNILKNTFTKAIALTIFLSFSVTNAQGVFISEYGEGSGNNKWLEIYNNSGADVDLSEYSVSKSTNSGQQE